MTEEQKATRENQRVPFDLASCMAMMEELMGRQGGGCDCTEMMSQMMASCCGVQGDTEKTTSTDATQEA